MDQTTLLLVLRKIKDSFPEQTYPPNPPSKNPPDPSSSNLQVLSSSNPPPFSHNPPNPPENPQVINTEYFANKSEDLEINQERNINYAINLEENNISSNEGAIELNLPEVDFNTDEVKTDTILKNTDETNTELDNNKYQVKPFLINFRSSFHFNPPPPTKFSFGVTTFFWWCGVGGIEWMGVN